MEGEIEMVTEVNGVRLALNAGDADDGDAGRQMRGALIAAVASIKKTPAGYKIPSQSNSGSYIVNLDGDAPYCSCPDFELRRLPCKHIFSVEYLIRREERDGVITETKAVRVTYKQDWPAYNAAQVNEGDHFLVLLRELCDTVEQPVQSNGRPRLLLSDMLAGMAIKVYSGMSSRRAMSFIREAVAKGLIEKEPSFSSVCRYMDSPEIKPILQSLIEQSALPLKAVETDFAADSSGFATTTYHRWFDHKWNREIKEAQWVKAHIFTGVKTNIVTTADVTETIGNDSPYMAPFVKATARNFDVKEVSGDKAYLSKGNLWAVHDVGATPYIPFKTNSVAYTPNHRKDPLWMRMFAYFHENRAEFLAHYHKRSNVESSFSMIKAKFGPSVRSKNPAGQVNETLVKILVHNIVVLVHAMYELGITPLFTGGDASEPQPLLPPRMAWR